MEKDEADRPVGPPVPGLRTAELDDGAAVYVPGTEEAVVLNQTAADTWALCDGERGLADIVDLLARSYGVDPEQILDDVRRTIAELDGHGLLQR